MTSDGGGLLGVAPSLHRRRQELAQVLFELAPPHLVLSDFHHFERLGFGHDHASYAASPSMGALAQVSTDVTWLSQAGPIACALGTDRRQHHGAG